MAIDCSSNPLLEKLNASKDALNNKLAELQSAGAAAMADITAKADQMKADLLAAIPELPEIPNFKKELAELSGKVGKELAEAKAAFKERWGDALPDVDIDGLMNKVTSAVDSVEGVIDDIEGAIGDAISGAAGALGDAFDLCKDVPNIDAGEIDENGKVASVVVKAEEPTTATEIPEKVVALEPTVVEKEKQPSSSPAADGKSRKEIYDNLERNYLEPINELKLKYTQPMLKEKLKELNKFKAKRSVKKLFKKIKSKYNNKVADYLPSASSSDKKILIEYFSLLNEGRRLNKISEYIDKIKHLSSTLALLIAEESVNVVDGKVTSAVVNEDSIWYVLAKDDFIRKAGQDRNYFEWESEYVYYSPDTLTKTMKPLSNWNTIYNEINAIIKNADPDILAFWKYKHNI